MPLILKALNKNQEIHSQFTFSKHGGSIGRGKDSTWHLNGDFLSRKHASITFKNNSYYITDHSTNGIILNKGKDRIQKEIPHKIRNHDTFKIDCYEILAILEEEKSSRESNNNDPYAIFQAPPEYTPPNVETTPGINEPIKLEKNPSTSAPAKEKVFEVNTAIFETTPLSTTDAAETSSTTDDLEIFSVGGNIHTVDPSLFHRSTNKNELIGEENPSDQQQETTTMPNTQVMEEDKSIIPENPPIQTQATTQFYEKIMEGAGISYTKNKEYDTEDFFRLTGLVLHECIQGIIELLKSRTEIKDHLRLENTYIGQNKETNPLKFMPNASQVIMQALLNDSDNSGYLPIDQAIQEAFDDIKSHQFALSMSVQDALKTTIQHHFSPKKIRKKLEKDSSIINKIPLQREAKLWSMFENLYSEIELEASETFELLLEREIAKAYKLHNKELKYHREVQKKQK